MGECRFGWKSKFDNLFVIKKSDIYFIIRSGFNHILSFHYLNSSQIKTHLFEACPLLLWNASSKF